MVARHTLVRNGSRTQSEGRDQEGVSKARPLPNLTASPLNLVNVHRSVFKAYPWCRQPYVLRPEPGGGTIRAWRGMGESGGVPHSLRRSAQACTCDTGAGPSAIRAAAAGNGLEDFRLFTGTGVLDKMPDVDDAIGAGVVGR